MLKSGSLLKLISGLFLVVVVAGGGGFAFYKSAGIQTIGGDPEPGIGQAVQQLDDSMGQMLDLVSAEQHRDCSVVARYKYTGPNNGQYKIILYRAGVDNGFNDPVRFGVAGEPGVGEFMDESIPQGTWKYRFGLIVGDDVKGVKYTEWSDPITIDSDQCSPKYGQKPLNSLVWANLVPNCSVQVNIQVIHDLTPGRYGIYIYRDTGSNVELYKYTYALDWILNEDGIGHIIDEDLPVGTYRYQTEIYVDSELKNRSEWSNEVTISDSSCKSMTDIINPDAPIVPAIEPIATNTPIAVSDVVPQACIWQAAVNIYLRKGPDVNVFDTAASVEKGKTFPVVGQSEDGKFWVVEFEPGNRGYVSKSDRYSIVSGDCNLIPTSQDPEPPVPQSQVPSTNQKPDESESNPAAVPVAPSCTQVCTVNPFTGGQTCSCQ